MKSRAEIKDEAKSVIKDNLKFFILATLPITVAYYMTRFQGVIASIGLLLWTFTLIGLSFMCLNMVNNKQIEKPLTATLDVFSKKYFWPMLKLTFAITIRLVGWLLLLIVPGIIKGLEYSQSFYILKDHIDKGEEVTSTQCIKESQELMKGEKGKLMVLALSFLGWAVLIGVIEGLVVSLFGTSIIGWILLFGVTILDVILFAYIYYSQVIFYTELVKNK